MVGHGGGPLAGGSDYSIKLELGEDWTKPDGEKRRRFLKVQPLDIIALGALLVAVIVAVGSYAVSGGLDKISSGTIVALLGASAISAYAGRNKRSKEGSSNPGSEKQGPGNP